MAIKRQSRTARWLAACAAARAAVDELKEIQDEYQDWLDNLPENLQDSVLGEKLNEVCDLDLEDIQASLEEAEALDLPLGFGRD